MEKKLLDKFAYGKNFWQSLQRSRNQVEWKSMNIGISITDLSIGRMHLACKTGSNAIKFAIHKLYVWHISNWQYCTTKMMIRPLHSTVTSTTFINLFTSEQFVVEHTYGFQVVIKWVLENYVITCRACKLHTLSHTFYQHQQQSNAVWTVQAKKLAIKLQSI